MSDAPIKLDDLLRLVRSESPDLPARLTAFLGQDDTYAPLAIEVPGDEPGDEPKQAQREAPEGWISFTEHTQNVATARRKRGRKARIEAQREAWTRFTSQDPALLPPRFALAGLLEELYERKTPTARALLIAIVRELPLRYGAWRGLKRVYKRAEAELDAEVFGALAARFDQALTEGSYTRDVQDGTLAYLRRRAWRALRHLGQATPDLYPQVAAQVLRHYGSGANLGGLWVINHILAHGARHTATSFVGRLPPDDMVKHRAFSDAWKRAPEELMFVLESAQHDAVARFAIQGLQKDFPDRLRNVKPAWLGRLVHRKLASIDEFVVDTLLGSPDFHQGKLRELGLHDAVLDLLGSGSDRARKYAIEYARGHARDLGNDRLFELIDGSHKDVAEMARTLLKARPARELGHVFLGKLLTTGTMTEWATQALSEQFERKEIPASFLVDMIYGEDRQRDWARKYIEGKYPHNEIGAAFWTKLLDEPRSEQNDEAREVAFKFLGKYKAAEIGSPWLLEALARPWLSDEVGELLEKATSLPGLDIERLKGMVFNASLRPAALTVLGNRKLVSAEQIGLPWLLAMVKRADEPLRQFARRYLLEHLTPADFAGGDATAGVARLFALALGEREAEPVRAFAQSYLLCHHPKLGPEQTDSKQLDLKPLLKDADYDRAQLWDALFDGRSDVRRFALELIRPNLRAWGLHTRIYELVDVEPKEVRQLAYDALEGAGQADADPAVALRPEELDAARIFQMTESPRRPTRQVATELIRRHYGRLGGAERLGWLMQSADREVRLFAVRLLWEKHRPRSYPAAWKPRQAAAAGALEAVGKFDDVQALQGLLRRLMFGLPPGRAPQSDSEEARRKVSASVVKRNVVELVRDLGVEDATFATLVAPVLHEFSGALARGEWQACLSALAHLQKAHPQLEILRA